MDTQIPGTQVPAGSQGSLSSALLSKVVAVLVYHNYTDICSNALSYTESYQLALQRYALRRLQQVFGAHIPIYSNLHKHLQGKTEKQSKTPAETVETAIHAEHAQCLKSSLLFIASEVQEKKQISEASPIPEDASIAICYSYYPFLDLGLTHKALNSHIRYLSHFCYGENIPLGFLPDFAALSFVSELPRADGQSWQKGEEMRAYALKHADRYDIEIFYQSPDLRQYRLDFSSSSTRNQKVLSRILANTQNQSTPPLSYAQLKPFIYKQSYLFRGYPNYFEIELSSETGEPSLQPFYWPQAQKKAQAKYLAPSLLDKLQNDICKNACNQEITIALGGLGEASLHPQFLSTLRRFLQLQHVKRIYWESFAHTWNRELLSSIFELSPIYDDKDTASLLSKLSIIIRLSTLKRPRYQSMYGLDALGQVLSNLSTLEELCKQSKEQASGSPTAPGRPLVYIEVLRIRENEDELDDFQKYFKDKPFEIIFQKYNRYIQRLPERRSVDLDPIIPKQLRFCWHLARDIYLTVDGKVPLCKQDPFAEEKSIASFADHSIPELLEKTQSFYMHSMRGEHEEVQKKTGLDCMKCNEWYTFNA